MSSAVRKNKGASPKTSVLPADEPLKQLNDPTQKEGESPAPIPETLKLRNPDQILFVAQSKSYTNEAVPAVLMIYHGLGPKMEIFQRLEAVLVDRNIHKKKCTVELTFLFEKDIKQKLHINLADPPVESVQVSIELERESTDVFFDEFNKCEQFVWAVTSLDYNFSALITRKTQDIDVARVELRCLH